MERPRVDLERPLAVTAGVGEVAVPRRSLRNRPDLRGALDHCDAVHEEVTPEVELLRGVARVERLQGLADQGGERLDIVVEEGVELRSSDARGRRAVRDGDGRLLPNGCWFGCGDQRVVWRASFLLRGGRRDRARVRLA